MFKKLALYKIGPVQSIRTFASEFEIDDSRILKILAREGVDPMFADIHIIDAPDEEDLDERPEPGVLKTWHYGEVLCIGSTARDAVATAKDRGISLRCVDLSGMDLSGMDLSGMDLSESMLKGTNLEGCNLSGTDLNFARLHGANLVGATMTGCNLKNTGLSGADVSLAIGLVLFGEDD